LVVDKRAVNCLSKRRVGSIGFLFLIAECRTKIMAKDAIALMDHLGWRKAHIFGHSMGESVILSFPFLLLPLLNVTEINCSQQLILSLVYVTVETGAMIACKLAAMVPDRVLSLALLNVTGGGFECLPKVLYIFMSLLSCAVVMFLRTLQH